MVKTIAKKDTIFIIDDSRDNIKVLEAMLVELNYSVRVAFHGSTAIKSIIQAPPDLILMDVKMPDMDGYEVCKRLKSNKITKHIPIIFISGLDEIDAKVKALSGGGNDYMIKPLHFEEVSARIQTHLAIRKMQKELESKNIELQQEIVEREQAEKLILKSEEQYSSIINDVLGTSNVGIFLLDKEFRVMWVNKAIEAYFGLERDEIIGKNNKQLIKNKICKIFEDKNEFKQTVLRTYDKNISEERFVCHVLSDNDRKERWLEHWSKPITSGLYSGGRVEQYTDITNMKLAEKALMQSEKMKALDLMASGVAHEFNNILAVISSNAQLLEETHAGDKELMYALSTICRMSDDGAEIVSKMYEFTNTLKDTSHHTNIDLYDLVNQVIDFTMPRWKKMAQARGINYQIVWGTVRDLLSVVGNPSELREVVLNIINNALDSMPAGGIITVEARYVDAESKIKNKMNIDTKDLNEKSGFIEISFKDTGKGMTEEVKKMIFDPFFTTKGPEGTGLGMSVSYGIIIRHGGRISVESELGNGSIINMRLPVAGTHSRHAVKSRHDSRLNTNSLRILVVDDEVEMCKVLYKFFFNEGHKVRGVNNGVQAIELLNENNYDLLICDLVMPGVNGRDVVNSLKMMNKRPKVGVVTGWKYSMEDAEKEGLEVDFITRKPFDMYNLRKEINDLLI
jgi:PAS domain S-box-containing protein